jgi:hypothetical protein
MKPVRVSTVVDRPREEVYAFLDVLANHERFTDHFLRDWTLSGPAAGAGARARFRIRTAGRDDWMEGEVLEADAPERTVERTVGAKGKRVTRGTFALEELPDGRTEVSFEIAFLQAPPSERLAAPLVRSIVRRDNARAMERLRALMASAVPAA